MAYDPKLIAWFACLSPAQRLEVALEAEEFRREARRDLECGDHADVKPALRPPAPRSPRSRSP